MSADLAVVVLGAGGATGRRVVAEALHAGHRVTATARDPDRLRSLLAADDLPSRPVVVRADVTDETSLDAAIDGHDVVVSAVGPPGRRADGLYSAGARATVAAMDRCGVDRFVGVTSAGVRRDDPELALWYRLLVRPLLRELYDDMIAMEAVVTAGELDWTLVRPVLLLDRDATDRYRVDDAATPPHGRSITRGDVARFIVTELRDRRWSRRRPTIAH
ncbi:NAD(P)-binding oxidoreductase [Actinomycetospora sp. NBRC 106378]|uniref:NAD(P)-dependent oxidoreductase n=1 Tax=Actinomycetospora sp. NBRC 106378 TaxID=3032208 RepID=UPI0024A38CF6|nr:NAD(P)-binding oxidoreductase [Actinomycetospora sp. NBRC 106378]GLZ55896.1 NmrA family transcriptional regulator [Actinomycetospora sp. NBRC 106378]